MQDWPGSRGPIICLPDLTATGRSFDPFAAALAPAWRILSLDLRGRGRSSRPPAGYGYQVHVADALAFIDYFGFERVVLVGHGYGATIALHIAAWFPQRVERLILLDGGTGLPSHAFEATRHIVRQLATLYPSLQQHLDALHQAPWLQPWTPEFEAYFLSTAERTPEGGIRFPISLSVVDQELRAYADGPPDFSRLYQSIECPALVLRAAGGLTTTVGPALPPAEYQSMLQRIPHAHGVEIPDTNHHTLLLANPNATIREVQTFLAIASEEWERKPRRTGNLADFFAASPLRDAHDLLIERRTDLPADTSQ